MVVSLALRERTAAELVGVGVGGRGPLGRAGLDVGRRRRRSVGVVRGGGAAGALAGVSGLAAVAVDAAVDAGRDLFVGSRVPSRAYVRQVVSRRRARLRGA